MARANPFDPKASSVASIQYVTHSSTNTNGILIAYPFSGQTSLTELSPKGVIAQPNTLNTTPPW